MNVYCPPWSNTDGTYSLWLGVAQTFLGIRFTVPYRGLDSIYTRWIACGVKRRLSLKSSADFR